MKTRGSGDDGGIDAAEEFAIIGHDRDGAFGFGKLTGFVQRIGNADEFELGNLLGEPRVNAAEMTSADDCDANFVAHSEAPMHSALVDRKLLHPHPGPLPKVEGKYFLCRAASIAGAAVFAFLLCLDETQKFVDCRNQFVVGPQDFAGVIEPNLGAVEQSVRFR